MDYFSVCHFLGSPLFVLVLPKPKGEEPDGMRLPVVIN